MDAKKWMTTVALAAVAAWAGAGGALGAEAMVKGVKAGDSIEKAHEQFKARMPEGVEVSEIGPAGNGEARQFTLDGGQGVVLGDDHDRVQYLYFSGALCVKLFGPTAVAPEEFAGVLTEAWELPPTAWTASWAATEDGGEVAYWRTATGDSIVTLEPGGGLSIKRVQKRDVRRVLR